METLAPASSSCFLASSASSFVTPSLNFFGNPSISSFASFNAKLVKVQEGEPMRNVVLGREGKPWEDEERNVVAIERFVAAILHSLVGVVSLCAVPVLKKKIPQAILKELATFINFVDNFFLKG